MKTTHPVLPPFYSRYVDLVSDVGLLSLLEENGRDMRAMVNSWSPEEADFRYAPDKWAAREVIMHLIDSERIFSYRALRFARKDHTPLPGFDENSYAQFYGNDKRTLEMLIAEMKSVRDSTISLFKSFDSDALNRRGEASGISMTVRTIGEIIAGHELHHKKVLEEKYFPK
ncbi:DinB family protein [Fulvivirga sedimenti]|uniref:DinB family protein n=1 Tax=Fulvivirga sedimenti TaxID=2879465 RepID=A0A9X1HVT4_9BACT|nr:DinB family protein [Fulvivirga sedimenti]MCA6078581.1 DinB family protein [Fulvivirga sedimenti]